MRGPIPLYSSFGDPLPHWGRGQSEGATGHRGVHGRLNLSHWFKPCGSVLCALILLTSNAATARDSFTRLKADEQIVFFPTIAQRVPGKDEWRLEIHGCVFEPEERSLTL